MEIVSPLEAAVQAHIDVAGRISCRRHGHADKGVASRRFIDQPGRRVEVELFTDGDSESGDLWQREDANGHKIKVAAGLGVSGGNAEERANKNGCAR